MELHEILIRRLGERIGDYLYPPPVFKAMQGELVELDLANGSLSARFPVLESTLNPYGSMQGGMIAAAVDNTLGPLSAAVAPPNVTRTLEMKYSRPATPEMGTIVVRAELIERKGMQLVFRARVSSPDGGKLATCRAVHWIIGGEAQAPEKRTSRT
jgi:acyl-coenzyme A thioesterase PaaI-like protein